MRRVDPARIATMRLGKRPAQPVGIGRHQDQVDMVWHQAPGEAPHALRGTGVGYEAAIGGIIIVSEEHRLPPVAALHDMVSDTRNDDASETGHPRFLVKSGLQGN